MEAAAGSGIAATSTAARQAGPATGGMSGARQLEAGSTGAAKAGTGTSAQQPVSGSAGATQGRMSGAGASAGVAANGGTAGMSSAGSGSLPAANGCDRALLSSTVDAYFVALAAHDPSSLPLADGVKFTENGKTLELGKAGLWTTAGSKRHAHSALDVDACSSVTQAVVPDGDQDIPVAVRLKLDNQKITEIETIAVRDGDYMLASNTEALSSSAMTVHWEEAVPADQRNTREELEAWITKYFRMFPRGVCNTTSDCKRIENGGGSFNCSAGASCATTDPGPNDNALEPRLVVADIETGIGVGFTMFQTNTDMHMFKMHGGKVYGVSAILGKASSAGWE